MGQILEKCIKKKPILSSPVDLQLAASLKNKSLHRLFPMILAFFLTSTLK